MSENKNEKAVDIDRSVRDIWKAIQVGVLTMLVSFCLLYIGILFSLASFQLIDDIYIEYALNSAIGLTFIIGLLVFIPYSKGISLKNDIFSWPASDVENSLMDILTLKRVRGLFYRESVSANQIEYVTNDFGWKGFGGTKKRVYGLNITGDFGSRNIRFNSKQKRDEARNILKLFSKSRVEADIAFN